MRRPKNIFTAEVVDQLSTIFNDKWTYVNPWLLTRQKAWKNAEAIRDLHYYRYALYEIMETCPEVDLPGYDRLCDGIEECLQDLWNFPRDKRFVRFWDRPKCTCPKFDNEEWYPTGRHSISFQCPLHAGGTP